MNKVQQEVLAFHRQFDCFLQETPNADIPETLHDLRANILQEEVDELKEAMGCRDVVAIADALADILYITYGTACTYGIDMEPIFEEVHRTNMLKTGGGKRHDGKILKPPGWERPKIAEILKRQSVKRKNAFTA
jgi:predicted HAD superfamily Cof-like phosphohydrolase